MNRKLLAICLITIGIISSACRQTDEEIEENTVSSIIETDSTESTRRDSLAVSETDPPRDGTHWKTNSDDAPKNISPKMVTKKDSLSPAGLYIDDGNGPKDPPRDGTHWKTNSDDNPKNVLPKLATKRDSISTAGLYIDDGNGPKDPPRDGTHWKKK